MVGDTCRCGKQNPDNLQGELIGYNRIRCPHCQGIIYIKRRFEVPLENHHWE
jgi:DNA-directed RNA polymerase subunit RPC12/RpoP